MATFPAEPVSEMLILKKITIMVNVQNTALIKTQCMYVFIRSSLQGWNFGLPGCDTWTTAGFGPVLMH
jgi:hypothetical protein